MHEHFFWRVFLCEFKFEIDKKKTCKLLYLICKPIWVICSLNVTDLDRMSHIRFFFFCCFFDIPKHLQITSNCSKIVGSSWLMVLIQKFWRLYTRKIIAVVDNQYRPCFPNMVVFLWQFIQFLWFITVVVVCRFNNEEFQIR